MSDHNTVCFALTSIQTSKSSHELLSEFAQFAQKLPDSVNRLIIDMSSVNFIASNQFAIFGSILHSLKRSKPNIEIVMFGIQKNIANIIGKNGFYRHLNLPKVQDQYNTVIPYKIFKTSEIIEYGNYLTTNLFSRKDLPNMSSTVRDNIRDYLLEIFKNASDHTDSQYIYTCGQYFSKSSLLYFTLVDIGETIRYNVDMYYKNSIYPAPENALQWALIPGNSTINDGSPRGLGLSLIQSFVKLNKGQFFIISENETYEITSKGERYDIMKNVFPGTIVTLAFNLNDTAMYVMENEVSPEIQF